MNITEKQKKELFAMAKGIRTQRDTTLSLYDAATTKGRKKHFLKQSIIHAASEQGVASCFKTLGLSKEYADYMGDTSDYLPQTLFDDALTAEKSFLCSLRDYRYIHSDDKAKKRQKCREYLAVYRSYIKVFSILEITEEYKTYKGR